ncbi:MAG: flavin reductase family protein [Candidatus Marinimicrobia bacterium]|jgi:flavin reductase (DIM6/NTAB) family NADH-FMN oxidoreductase RutF|nr:flavin reductase family protein [Candidatus Neomarinimicrobiota bacterium]MBT3796200.1 flavin reductase family protein [Candidatus Neomarinimicrobiota bacterium]MBT7424406.1 flavin reductase family protein [Candidatus Neomarinimicrobiota bacterium]MDG1136211.1 flavin reductase family protein [Bacteroidales bacterium]MDG2367349.1 flavin reductase family protein [Candidatus Neomarinimicrobiota bacterium]|tara:strand:- start:3016 stop:3636 length:621 start_codon:yes stop_codon:yes gene_type:complete
MNIDPTKQSFQENHKLMIGSIVPRPIAFVSTKSTNGILNLAPFSYFNGVCSKPPTIMFAPARRGYDGLTKDTLNNIRSTKEFVVNLVSEEIVEPMVECATDYDKEIDEFKISNLTPIDSDKISSPRVKESKVSYECELNTIVEIGEAEPGAGFVVIGTIVMFHIQDDVYNDGRIDLKALNPIGRLAGNSYTRVFDNFKVIRKIKPD